MAKPHFTFHSIDQAGVSIVSEGGGWTRGRWGSGRYDSYVPGFEVITNGAAQINTRANLDFAGLAEGWIMFKNANTSTWSNFALFTLKGATFNLLRLFTKTSGGSPTYDFQYWDGAAWVTIGATLSNRDDKEIVIHWKIDGAAGVFELYTDGVLTVSFSGDTLHTADTEITTASFGGGGTGYTVTWYNIFVDTVDVRGVYWVHDEPLGTGQYSDWTNGTDSELRHFAWETQAAYNYLIANTAGLKMTTTLTTVHSIPAAAGTVEAVFLSIYGKANAEPALYMKPLLHKSGIDYNPAGSVQMLVETNNFAIELPVDPSTGLAWASVADVQAFQMGWQSSATG